MILQLRRVLPISHQDTGSTAGGPDPDLESWLTLDGAILNLIRIGVILALAVIGYRFVKLLTSRLERDIAEEDPLVKRMREQRARTLAGLINNVALVAIITITALMILDVFLDNIGPLLAGVGVFGLAISFGAQSLVKDVISGAFILLEGQYGIGDVVRISDTAGMVEKITLRTTTLRDLEGAVHVIPNGEITRVSNLTKAWSRAVLDLRISYRDDVDRVLDVLRELGRSFAEDPEWNPLLMDEPEVLGVQDFTESAIIVRLIIKTLPLKQWDVAREFRRRIKKRFDEEGITIPFPHVTLDWGDRAPESGPRNAREAAARGGRSGDVAR